jgi:hypothetical protein
LARSSAATDADEELDELRTVDRKERYGRLAGDGACQQGLARAGRADQQDSLGDAGAEPAVDLRLLEEGDDFFEFVLGFVDAGHVVERHLDFALHEDFGAALADRHHRAHALSFGELTEHEKPDRDEEHDREDPRQDVAPQSAFDLAAEDHAVTGEEFSEVGLDADRLERAVAGGGRHLQAAVDQAARDGDLGDIAGLELTHEIAVGQPLDPLDLSPHRLQQQDEPEGDDQVPKVELSLFSEGRPVRDSSGR